MSDVYRTVAGFVQFPPEKRVAGSTGKTVRNVQIENLSNGNRVAVTLWPDHDGVKVEKGDLMFASGKFTTSAGQNKEGDAVTYYNLSANNVAVVKGAASGGKGTSSTPVSADEDGDADGW